MNTHYGNTMNFVEGIRKIAQRQFKANNIKPSFPDEILNLKEEDFNVGESINRKDFTNEKAFTIDGENCKDMDDAVCVSRTSAGFRLAVHIADVSAYVPIGSRIDDLAVSRATSIYLPHSTIPMLPKILSNNLCSLNPGQMRCTLSVIAHIRNDGEIIRSEVTKGKVCSRVKGVYSEINKIISGAEEETLKEKYSEVYDEIFMMEHLYQVLRRKRLDRGSKAEDSNKPIITLSKHAIKLTPYHEGVAENMIEEFMILANRIVAQYIYENDLPAIFRVQEKKGSMASYKTAKTHHAELALDSYSHFTSPIRRLADLKIHQIISMHLDGCRNEEIHRLFDESLTDICEKATKRSRTARQIQNLCEHYCYEQYFQIHRNDRYTGKLVNFDKHGRPIIKINKYNVQVIGYAILDGAIGEQYSFNVGISNKRNELIASRPIRMGA